MSIWSHIVGCLKDGGPCALVTVVDVGGSTPREEGARMVVRPDQSFFGTIGGGNLEFEAIRKAAAMTQKGEPLFVQHSVSLGPDLGQCCGGRAKLSIEVLTDGLLESAEALVDQERRGEPFGTTALLENGRLGARRLLNAPPVRPFACHENEDTETPIVTERFGETRRALVLFGAGHVGKALVLAMAPLPFVITWVDSRRDQFPGPVPANVTKVCVDDPSAVLDQASNGAFVLAMTHSHALDEEIMARALLQQRFAYCGVIGSKTKKARFHKRLNARGLDNALIANMICPVGNTTIKSKHPAAIAAGIAVDLLERNEIIHQQASAGPGLAQEATHGQ